MSRKPTRTSVQKTNAKPNSKMTYQEFVEKAIKSLREHAFDLMLTHAAEMGANAVIGFRYDATEIAGGVTEVLAYGTAVVVEPK